MNGDQLRELYTSHFGSLPAAVVASPGRINLIGEHIDYNGGFVLPAAIDKKVWVAIGLRDDQSILLKAIDQPQSIFETSLNSLQPSALHWPNYILGVVQQAKIKGVAIKGFNLLVTGDIPTGAGVSSSAALECATLFALNEVFNWSFDRVEMARMAQAAENKFVGVNCGIMDQFASLMGKEDQVLKLNCDTLEYSYFPFLQDDCHIVLFDTQVKHSLASSAYNERRRECEEGLLAIQQFNPLVKALCQASLQELDQASVTATVRQRCRYVIEEQTRVNAACADLLQGDMVSFGKKMMATHEGLRDLYQVSCEELDFIVSACQQYPEVLGARLMGGGFGGCVIALIRPAAIHTIAALIGQEYESRFGKKMLVHQIQIGEGTALQ